LLISKSEEYKHDLLPGYTHLQLAMPSSFGLWFGAYAESLVDDTITLKAAFDVVNKNPSVLWQVMALHFLSTER
jgi:argininosuccinate lyase